MSATERVVVTEVSTLQAKLAVALHAQKWDEAENASLQITSVIRAMISIQQARLVRANATRLGISLDEQHPLRSEKLNTFQPEDLGPTRKQLYDYRTSEDDTSVGC